MKVQVKEPGDGFSEFLSRALKSAEVKKIAEEIHDKKSDTAKENSDKPEAESIDIIKIRQLEQKQELLVGLTNLLFKKFEEIHPTKKYSKFEFTDLSWYKKLGTV